MIAADPDPFSAAFEDFAVAAITRIRVRPTLRI